MAYADERDAGGTALSPYRGQNANMHTVEALIAAFEATGEARYLDRGDDVARQFTVTLAKAAEGQVWEHYTEDWQHDWTYNIDKPDDLFKPWGFQPGHQVEWRSCCYNSTCTAPPTGTLQQQNGSMTSP